MQMIKHFLKYISIFFITVVLLTGLLVASAKIPQSSVRENVKESAEYLCEGKLFGTVVSGAEGSRIDRYADSILLAIAWQYDSEHPLRSVMWSSYYYTDYQNENDNLFDAVTNMYEPNCQYMRYWHGSIAVVRPLLIIFNIQKIYILNGIIMIILTLYLAAVMIKNRMYVPAIGVAAGLIITAFWFVPYSLEYTWTYLIMLLMSVIGVKLALSGKWNCMGIYFLIGGIVTNYMDFLTTETLTLTVPLLLICWIRFHESKNASDSHKNAPDSNKSTRDSHKNIPESHIWEFPVMAALSWGTGYIGMWVMKWIIASVVLHENMMPYISGHIGERLGGDIGISQWSYIFGAVWNNVKCLFPFGYGSAGVIAGIVLVIFALYLVYVYHRKHICKEHVLLYALIGIVPYIRYIILHNHSYLHCFFTYRAQFATVLAIVLIMEELSDWRWLVHDDNRRRKP